MWPIHEEACADLDEVMAFVDQQLQHNGLMQQHRRLHQHRSSAYDIGGYL